MAPGHGRSHANGGRRISAQGAALDRDIQLDFMVAGVQKGGTTSLYETLRGHPEIGMSRRKEVHFFDEEKTDWTNPNYRALHRQFTPGFAVYGEATPVTLYYKPAHWRIRAYNSDLRFILIFRDPIERAYSNWCMQYARNKERRLFAQVIRSEHETKRNRHVAYVNRGFYGFQIDTLCNLFPKRNMLFLLSEEFRDHRAAVLAKIGDFLNVDPKRFGPDDIVTMVRPKLAYPSTITEADREWLRGTYARDLLRFAKITGLDIGRWSAAAKVAG